MSSWGVKDLRTRLDDAETAVSAARMKWRSTQVYDRMLVTFLVVVSPALLAGCILLAILASPVCLWFLILLVVTFGLPAGLWHDLHLYGDDPSYTKTKNGLLAAERTERYAIEEYLSSEENR